MHVLHTHCNITCAVFTKHIICRHGVIVSAGSSYYQRYISRLILHIAKKIIVWKKDKAKNGDHCVVTLQLVNYWRGNISNTASPPGTDQAYSGPDNHQEKACLPSSLGDIQDGEAEIMKTRHSKNQQVRMP